MSSVESIRLEANAKFKAGDFQAAAELYEKGIDAADKQEKEKEANDSSLGALAAEKLKLLNNLSTSRRKLQQFGPALEAAKRAVTLDPKAPKSRLLRAVLVAEKANTKEENAETSRPPAEAGDPPPQRVLSDAALAALLEPSTLPQLLVAFEHVAKMFVADAAARPGAAGGGGASSSSSFKISPTTAKGDDLGVFATADIPRCTTIFDGSKTLPFSVGIYAETVSAPFVPSDSGAAAATAATATQKNTTVCTCCGRCRSSEEERITTIFPCNGCGLAAFCEDCVTKNDATKSWVSERHRNHECQRMQKLQQMFSLAEQQQREGSDELVELGFHIISTIASIEYWQEHESNSMFYDVAFLLGLKGDPSSGCGQLMAAYGRELQIIHSIFDEEAEVEAAANGSSGDAKTALRDKKRALVNQVAGICLCNSFGCSDNTGLPSCQVLFSNSLSRFNHSCAPNCEFDATNRAVRTIADVPSGGQFCISYIASLHYPREQRREQMKKFFFTCECERCNSSSSSRSSINDNEWMLTATCRENSSAELEGAMIRAHSSVTQNIVEFARARPAEEVTSELLADLQQRQGSLLNDLKRTHFLVQDLRNAITYCASAVDNGAVALRSSVEEFFVWEALFPGVALPAKKDKLRNMILCVQFSGSSINDETLKQFVANVAKPLLAVYEPQGVIKK